MTNSEGAHVARTIDYKKAISTLNSLWSPSFGVPVFSKDETLSQIEKVEAEFSRCESFELEFKMGSAFQSYAFFFVRGDERKTYLGRAVHHLQRAYELAYGKNWDVLNHIKDEPTLFIGVCLGSLLIEEAQVRDLERGLAYLEQTYKATRGYEPAFCAYAEGLYKRGAYREAARVATELRERAQRDLRWRETIPPAPMSIAAKAYRAEAKRLKKEGNLQEALKVLQELIQTGLATANDQRLLERLITHIQGPEKT